MNATSRKIARRLTAAIRTAAQTSRATLTAALTSLTTQIRRIAAHAGFTTAQANAALELIEDGGIHEQRPDIYRTVSTDGTRIHLTTADRCTCPDGIKATTAHHRPCYHALAVRVLEAA
ncbi:hypothetical protein [Streptacidiphilus sp. PAMC 29251]